MRSLWRAALLLLVATRLDAATLDVCNSGCTYNNFQTAITAAVSGDTITLRAGQTFTGNFTFPNKSNASVITITSDASAGNLPGVGIRTSPAYSAFLPKIQASAGGSPAIQIQANATKYTFVNLEFLNNPGAYYTVVAVGYGDQTQTLASQEPTNIVFDRIYAHGDPVAGQKNMFAFNGTNPTLKNSYVGDVHAVGQDSQCVAGFNGSGGWTITNNYLECSTENIIIGGADPWERVYTTVTGASTTTSAVVTTVESGHLLSELASGQLIAVETNNTTTPPTVEFVTLTGAGPAATSGTLSWTPAVSVAPASGFRIRGGVVAKNITVTGNDVTKKLFWLTDGVLAKPTNVTATPNTASGSLAAGSHWYRVQAFSTHGYNNSTVWSFVSSEVRCDLPAIGKCDLAWADASGEDGYRIWSFSATGAPSGLYIDVAANTTSTSDTGALTLSGAYLPGTRVQEKNLFEIKAAQSVTVSGNVFDYAWKGSDIGYTGMWLKSVNQDGQCWWCQSRDITIEKNLFRHIDGWFLLSGREANGSGNVRPPAVTNLTLQNNLVYDNNPTWAEGAGTPYAMKVSDGTLNLVINHNTVICTNCQGLLYIYGQVSGRGHPGLVIQNNLVRREFYGLLDGDGTVSEGKPTLDLQAPGYTFTKNAIADANCAIYPTGNFCEAASAWQAEFVAYSADGTNSDYHLKATSPYHLAGTDGKDLGADIDLLNTTLAGVIQGVSSAPPTITTTGLPNAIRTAVYPSTTLAATGGTTPYTWSVNAGSTLPTGLAFSSAGVLSGTPTATAGSYSFTLKVVDNAALSATQAYTITITNATSITTTSLSSAEKDLIYSVPLAATGDAAPYTWSVTVGGLPLGMTLSGAGVLSGTPTVAGTSNFTVRALGSLGTSATQALSLLVTTETRPCDRNIANNRSEGFIYRRKTAPTDADCTMRGDVWIDTSTAALSLNLISGVGPTTFTPMSVRSSLSGDGSLITNLNASELKGGTIPATAFPNVFPGTIAVGTSVSAPTIQSDYLAVNQTACATLSTTGSMRLCADAASGQLKASVNGTPYQSIASPSGALIQNGNAFGAPVFIGTTDAQHLNLFVNNNTAGPSATIWGQGSGAGNVYLNPNAANDIVLTMERDHTADSYAMGFTTANGRKAYLESITGSLQEAMGLADCTASTDYFWGLAWTTNAATWGPALRVRCDGAIALQNGVVGFNTAPTISSGFGTSPSITANNGTFAFEVNVGTGGTATSGVIGLPAATTGWNCSATDLTTQSTSVFLTKQTASSTTTATVTNYNTAGAATAWVASDKLRVSCFAY